ncbi:MAG: matrixin family metalloprotease [Ferruginibacter sp.]
MGEVELLPEQGLLVIHSVLFFYGDAANDAVSKQVAMDVAEHWNAADGKQMIRNKLYRVLFDIEGIWSRTLEPSLVYENTNPRNNYFRIEEYARGNISFVDGLNSNTGYFKLENLLNNSTTAAHEYGHSLGLDHPEDLDIRGKGVPGIMYPRGTLVSPEYQYDPNAVPGEKGGTLNPFTRRVLPGDIAALQLERLNFNYGRFAMIGNFTSVWHEKHVA